MKHTSRCTKQRKHPKTRLRLPDLEFSKTAVLNSLTSADGQRGYSHAIDEFVDWYCSEPRLTLNRTVVLRYRSYLEADTATRYISPMGRMGTACRLHRHWRAITQPVTDGWATIRQELENPNANTLNERIGDESSFHVIAGPCGVYED